MSNLLRTSHITLLSFVVIAWAMPAGAQTDWYFTPFVGSTFGAGTVLADLAGDAPPPQFIFGGSAGLWSQGILGIEGDFAYAPRFFERGNPQGVIAKSNVTTLGFDIVLTTPIRVTRESLRPYLVGGLGWMHATIEDDQGILAELIGRARNSVGMNVGGGAVGFLTPRTGIRFELRDFRSLERDTNPFTLERGSSLLSFWRATVGVVIRR